MTETEKIENIPDYMLNARRGNIPEEEYVRNWLEKLRKELLEQ